MPGSLPHFNNYATASQGIWHARLHLWCALLRHFNLIGALTRPNCGRTRKLEHVWSTCGSHPFAYQREIWHGTVNKLVSCSSVSNFNWIDKCARMPGQKPQSAAPWPSRQKPNNFVYPIAVASNSAHRPICKFHLHNGPAHARATPSSSLALLQ